MILLLLRADADPLEATARQVLLSQKAAFSNWDRFAATNNFTGWDATMPVCDWTSISCDYNGTIAGGWSL